jgi:hypothetical protein
MVGRKGTTCTSRAWWYRPVKITEIYFNFYSFELRASHVQGRLELI